VNSLFHLDTNYGVGYENYPETEELFVRGEMMIMMMMMMMMMILSYISHALFDVLYDNG